jgi:hypothetical protein
MLIVIKPLNVTTHIVIMLSVTMLSVVILIANMQTVALLSALC